MTANNPLHNRQSNTGSLKLLNTVQTLEHAKQLVVILHVKACTVVLDEIGRHVINLPPPYFNASSLALAGKLQGVCEQIDKYLFEQVRVGLALRQIRNLYLHISVLLLAA